MASFGWALDAMRGGTKVSREGWNGKGMWLCYVPGRNNVPVFAHEPHYVGKDSPPMDFNPRIDMFTADKKIQPGWLASQTDMLATDWGVAK